jgi:hypothetical protein
MYREEEVEEGDRNFLKEAYTEDQLLETTLESEKLEYSNIENCENYMFGSNSEGLFQGQGTQVNQSETGEPHFPESYPNFYDNNFSALGYISYAEYG